MAAQGLNEVFNMAKIYSIVYQPVDKKYKDGHYGDFIREPLQEANLITDHGIEGDAKAGKQPSRQLNILSQEWLTRVSELGYHTKPGEFGEQIIIEGLDLDSLEKGERLQIGAQALVEITMPRQGCERLEAAQGQSNDAYGGLVGKMARVVQGGPIRVGDEVLLRQAVLTS